jgi:alkaline phosphatase D
VTIGTRSPAQPVRLLVLTAALAAPGLVGGCRAVPSADGPADTFGIDFMGCNPAGLRGAVVFFVDGLNARVFQEMLEAGELPAIRKHFVDRGLYAPRAVASTPSVTLANETSFATGLFPGHHGIIGNNWFDRNRLLWRDYETIAQKNTLDGDYLARNLYEHFPDRTTFSLFFQVHRGATKFVENSTSAGPPFFFQAYEYVDRLALFRFHLVADVARKRAEFPAVTVVYNLAPDFRAYQHGVESKPYRDAIRHTDRQIGRVLADMDRCGVLKDLYILLLSDHSLCQVTRHLPLVEFLRERLYLDVAPDRLWEETPFEDRMSHYARHSVVTYGSGQRHWAICLRRPIRVEGNVIGYEGWPVRATPKDLRDYPGRYGGVNLIEKLIAEEAVDALAYAVGPNRVRVRRKTGEVELHQPDGPGGAITCRAIHGDDPLGWKGKVPADALAGKPQTARQWLAATFQTDYPDLPAQIVAYFRSRLAGDIAVFAAPQWDFQTGNRAGHGGLRPGDMFVPLLLAGPGIAPGRLGLARTVDVMPTILALLGRPVPPGLDGEPLVKVRGPG